MSFDKAVHPCNHHHNQNATHFHPPQKVPSSPVVASSSPFHSPKATMAFLSITKIAFSMILFSGVSLIEIEVQFIVIYWPSIMKYCYVIVSVSVAYLQTWEFST
jgi:hypothetical protein